MTYDSDSGRREPTFWLKSWKSDVAVWLAAKSLDFVPRIDETHRDQESGEEYVSVRFDCPHVTAVGRCGIYQTRPKLCRQFVPMEDQLCKFPR